MHRQRGCGADRTAAIGSSTVDPAHARQDAGEDRGAEDRSFLGIADSNRLTGGAASLRESLEQGLNDYGLRLMFALSSSARDQNDPHPIFATCFAWRDRAIFSTGSAGSRACGNEKLPSF